jgi:outer membrane protein assembly factor BamB
MKSFLVLAGMSLVFAGAGNAQGRSANWPTYGGDSQRSGWEKTDARITKDTVQDLQLLWKMKLETQPKGLRPLMPPVILGNLISYRGFKELAFIAGNSDIIYSIDADLGKMFWTKHLEYASLDPPATTSSSSCPGGLTAMPVMPPPPAAAAGRGGPAGGRGPAGPAPVYAISSDGRLHRLNTSTGDDVVQPVSVLPANASVYGLNMADNVIYAATSHECNGAADAVWAVDLMADPLKTTSFRLTGGGSPGLGGPVLGGDGTVYVQSSDRLLALSPRDLQVKQYFSSDGVTSPLVFTYKNRDVIVTAGKDGRLNLLDSDHLAPLYQTPVVGTEIWGNLSSWLDADGTRWVLAPVWGPVRAAPNGSIVAFKVEDQGGKPVLTQAWVSRDMVAPQPPVIASGVVFALSSGKAGSHATLYALDAATGKELYSSRNLITAPAALTGMTVANGRVYFGTTDGTFYTFGMYMEH